MSLLSQTIGLFGAFFTADNYYKALNSALRRFNDEYTMLHYPFYKRNDDSFQQSQKNLTDHCLSLIGELKEKSVLEIGCGNGVQACYVTEAYHPETMTGIDLNPSSIEIANSEKSRRGLDNIMFYVDDAQKLKNIDSESKDIVLNIESAFHYPDKASFLSEVHRVLKPGGQFLIADLVTIKNKGTGLREAWKKLQSLNHWNEEKYLTELAATNFIIHKTDDITESVVRGFRSYPVWFRQMQKKSMISNFIFKLFYRIIIHWYIFLLTHKRRYLVFAGIKN